MSLPEVISVRSDEVKQKKTDKISAYVTYIGRADFFVLPSEPKWQILRKVVVSGVESVDYADMSIVLGGGLRKAKGEYAFIWDNRASYFSPIVVPPPFTCDSVDIILANTEYSFTTAPGTKHIWLKTRQEGTIKVGEVSGFTSKYWTLFPGQPFDKKIDRVITFYFQSPKPNQTLEILSWS